MVITVWNQNLNCIVPGSEAALLAVAVAFADSIVPRGSCYSRRPD